MLGQRSEAAAAYDRFAPVYDQFNAQNDYEVWLGEVLLPELEKHGLGKGRLGWVLDVACGTGRAFGPLLRRGWRVVGCDASEGMLRQAMDGEHVPPVRLRIADARELGPMGRESFDLILALNDVVNYLTQDGDLERAFQGMKRNLAPHGLICFDANTLGLFATGFLVGGGMERGKFFWRGLTEELVEGGMFSAELGGPGVESQVHRERHWLPQEVKEALEASGLRTLALLGQSEDGPRGIPVLREPLDEQRDYKAIYIGTHDG